MREEPGPIAPQSVKRNGSRLSRSTVALRAVVRSEGKILDDHSFNLAGTCRVKPHELLRGAQAGMLPGL